MCSAVWRRKNEIANGSGIYQEQPERGGSSTILAGNNHGFSRRTQSQVGVEQQHNFHSQEYKEPSLLGRLGSFSTATRQQLFAQTPLAKTQSKRAHSRTDRIRQSNPASGRSGLKSNFQSGRGTDPAKLSKVLQSVSKEAVGVHVLLTRSLFGDDIPHRLLLRVSPAKSTSAPLRF